MAIAKSLLSGDGEAFEQITVSNSAIGTTAATWKAIGDYSTLRAFITISIGQIRYRYDGENPTSTSGHIAGFGDVIYLEGTVNISQFKAISTSAQDAQLEVTYEVVHG